MKKKYSLRLQMILILMIFVIAVMGLVYFVQTTFLDDFYKANKVKSLQNVCDTVAALIGEDDFDELIDHIGMSNEEIGRAHV